MKKTVAPRYIKTKVVIEFGNGTQAEAFFSLFNKSSEEKPNGLDLMLECIPNIKDLKRIESTKELKYNYLIKMV